MTLQTELLVDRRKLKRKLTGWRVLAVVLGVALLGAVAFLSGKVTSVFERKPHVARITISGFIKDDRKQQELLAKVAKSSSVKAVILNIDSRGGTTTGGEALYEAIRKLAEKKPVVSVMGTIATSAGYMIALGGDYVVARSNTITGSVGVIVQWPELSELLGNLGIKVEEVRSGALKANPSPFRPVDEAARAVTQEMVLEAQDWFLGLVARRRLISPESVPGLKAGRVYSGRMAKKHKLVDALGGETVARSWLEKEKQISKELKIVDWEESNAPNFGLSGLAAKLVGSVTGLAPESVQSVIDLGKPIRGGTQLDGLLSLWHPQAN